MRPILSTFGADLEVAQQYTSERKSYRVCHGFRLMKQDDYFRVNFDHF